MKPFKRLIGAALFVGIACSHLSAQESVPQESPLVIPNPDAWSIRTYDFISPGQMFVIYEKDGISVGVREVPKSDAGEAEVIAYIKKCTEIATESLKREGMEIPIGTLCVFDPGNAGLTVRTNQRTHEFLACLASQYRYKIPNYAEFRLQIIEGEAGLMRAMVAKAAQSADHTTLLTELESLTALGKTKNISNLSFSSRSGTRSSLTTNTEQQQLEAFTLKDRHLDNVEIATLPHGTSLEIDPFIEEDLRYLGFTYALLHDYAPPTSRWEPFRISGGQRIEAHVADRHRLNSSSQITLADNTSRLIGIWPTEKLATGETPPTLQAAFVRGRVISVSSLPETHVAAWLKAYAEQIEPTPQISETTDPPHPGMEARFFSTSSGFMSPSNSEAGEASSSTAPFSENSSNHDPNSRKWRTAVKALTACGVEFPEGSGATYLYSAGGILVRNTPMNLDLIERITAELDGCYEPKDLAITLQIVQADSAFLRKLEKNIPPYGDHSAAWKSLEEAEAMGQAKILRTVWIGSRSGQRSRVVSGDEHIRIKNVTPGTKETKNPDVQPDVTTSDEPKKTEPPKAVETPTVDPKPPGTLSGKAVVDQVGTLFEVDPVLGEDGRTIDLTFELKFDYAPPTLRNDPLQESPDLLRLAVPSTDYHRVHLNSSVTVIAGKPRLVGIWKPNAQANRKDADILQAAFIRVDVLRVADKYLPTGLKR